MDFTTDIGIYAVIGLAVGALLLGGVLQLIGEVRLGYEWLVTAVVAFAAGFIASEWITAWRTVEPTWDKMALIPAIGAALVVGILFDAALRYASHGSYMTHQPI